MDKEKFHRAVLDSAENLVTRVLHHTVKGHTQIPALVYDLRLVGIKPLLSVKSGGGFVEGIQTITFGETLTELIGGEWRLDEQYLRTKVISPGEGGDNEADQGTGASTTDDAQT